MAGAAGYGANSPSYGYYKPPQVSRVGTGNRSLALAAAKPTTQQDPFGLLTDTTDSARVARQNATPAIPSKTVIPSSSAPATSAATTPVAPPAASASTAPTPPAYDVNLDPTVQAISTLTGKTDEEAKAAALKQKQDLLLGYGDQNLASSVLGDQSIAQAAAQNPTSTLAQLADARGRNQKTLTEGLNGANLLYSGYRVNQEQQAANDYQNQLAQAAANVGGALSGVDSNLTSALGQSLGQRIQAMIAAGQTHAADPGAAPAAPDTGGATDGAGAAGPGDVLNTQAPNANLFGTNDPAIALALAAAQKRAAAPSGGGTRMIAS